VEGLKKAGLLVVVEEYKAMKELELWWTLGVI
jgi:hypothetical protein